MNVVGFPIHAAGIQTLGWTLIDFVWQGALVAATLAVLDALLARSRPHVRYLLGCVAMLSMLALPIATFVHRSAEQRDHRRVTAALAAQTTASDRTLMGALPRTETSAASGRPARTAPLTLTPLRHDDARFAHLGRTARRLSPSLLPWLVAVWSAGVMLLTLRLLGGWWLVRRMGRSTANVSLDDLQRH
jgi:hypothetical protein